jgi:catechol 2,3-dioxygenase
MRVMDLDAAVKHYTEIVGLIETARDPTGRVYLKAWDEHDHHSVVLRQADHPGMDYFAFKVADETTLDGLIAELSRRGIKPERIPEGDHVGTGRRVRFTVPTGHAVELYATKQIVGNGMPTTNPGIEPLGLKGARVTRLDHAALLGEDLEATVAIFTEVLGFQLTESVSDGPMLLAAFLSCGTKVHDIAFIRAPSNEGKCHHISFYVESWDDVLRAAKTAAQNGVSHSLGPTLHGITRGQTTYFFDPSGNRNETFTGGYIWYPDRPALKWTPDNLGSALFYIEGKVRDDFLTAT